jgi:hypothetical protein
VSNQCEASKCAGGLTTLAFGAPASYALVASSTPWSVAVVDLNGDSKLDVATANSGAPNDASVLLGTGTGTLGPYADYPAGNSPFHVLLHDMDQDGKWDMVVSNEGANTISVLRGNGNGTFQTQVVTAVGTAPYATAAGDFNGDGKPDLAVANYGSGVPGTGGVSLLLGNGTGTSFTVGTSLTATSSPGHVIAIDLNADSKLDLAVTDLTANYLFIYYGAGNGTFQAGVSYPTAAGPRSIAAADFNGDGKPDLAVADMNAAVGAPDANVFLNNGASFSAGTALTSGAGARWVVADDFNRDGMMDLAVANLNDNTIDIFVGKGNGSFGGPLVIGGIASPRSMASGDFNGDGKPDLVVASETSNAILVVLNTSH